MEEYALRQPELIGRDIELARLKKSLQNALEGRGSTIFIAGEAGIGKTRLVSELISDAEKKGAQVIRGWCLAESLEPLMPIKTALREAGLFHLISGDPPPLVVSTYLMNDAGMLIAKAEREQLELDSDIFAGMLQAVGNFVKDSLEMMDGSGAGSLNTLGYGDFTILIRTLGKLTMATVIKGEKSEFLIEDMKGALVCFGTTYDDWSGDVSATEPARSKISWFVDSGKYNGKFLVEDPKIRQENLFDNVLLGMQRSSENKPLLLFIDDLQWADPSTLGLLHYLSRNLRKHRVLLLGTYRPEDITQAYDGKTHQLETAMQNMSREDLLEKIELKRLDKASTESLINSVLGATKFDPGFYDKIHKETEGTPFFTLEILKLLAEEGAIVQDDSGAWALIKELDKLDLPGKVYDVVKRRLDRLMEEQRELLEWASVIGDEFSTDVLEKTTEIKKMTLLKNLSKIEKSHKLLHYLKDRYRFDHAKIREVLYNGISEELRREYHRLIADTIAELHRDNPDDVVSDLAYHYFEAGDGRAGEWLVKAADKAKEAYANEEAVRLYTNALEVVQPEQKLKILESVGDIQSLTGEFDKAIENFEKAGELTEDGEIKARVLRKIADVHGKKGEFDKSLDVVVAAKGVITDKNTAEYARLLLGEGNPHYRKGDYDKAMARFQEAIKLFGESGTEQRDIGNALRAIGIIHYSKGDYDPALEYYEKSLAVMEEIGEQYGIAAALNNIGIVHHDRGDFDQALEFYGRSLEMMEKIGDKRGIAISLNGIGNVHRTRGDFDQALEFHGRSLEMVENMGDKRGIATALNNIGIVHLYRGELDRALEFYGRSLEMREKMGDKQGIATALNNIGEVYMHRGELGKALEFHERSLEIVKKIGDRRLSIHLQCSLAEANLGLENFQVALENAEKAVATAAEIGAEEGMSRRVLGMVHREMKKWDNAMEEFGKAGEILEEVGDKEGLARLHYEHALLFRAMGDPAKARDYLDKALSDFDRMGMKLWAEKCRKALEELGE
ncbi:MAG: tetratricopeptide repeat protein [Thermoplasmata archaeon]